MIPKDPHNGQGRSSGEDQTDWEVSVFDFEDINAPLSDEAPILNIPVESHSKRQRFRLSRGERIGKEVDSVLD